jgi:putative addiction module component (TIGR02574 family)
MPDSRPGVDFSHLSPSQRILLAQDLWDSVIAGEGAPATTPEQRAEIERRIVAADAAGETGRPWRQVLDELKRN